jgi:hypothetical protein
MALLTVCTFFAASPAFAAETWVPYLAGSRIGLQLGTLPGPGLHFSLGGMYADMSLHDQNGNKTPVTLQSPLIIPALMWIPETKVLGATYAAEIVQPLLQITIQAPGAPNNTVFYNGGFFNTIIIPAMLAWDLPSYFHLRASLGIYIPDGSYSRAEGANLLGFNFWNIQPQLGATWLYDGWNVSAGVTLDLPTKNTETNYQTGDIASFDFNVSKSIDKLTLGAGVSTNVQFTNDTQNGQTVPNHKAFDLVAGPYVAYKFGKVTTALWYTNGTANNFFEGSKVWFRVGLPLPI